MNGYKSHRTSNVWQLFDSISIQMSTNNLNTEVTRYVIAPRNKATSQETISIIAMVDDAPPQLKWSVLPLFNTTETLDLKG